jgi:hypothetical protein
MSKEPKHWWEFLQSTKKMSDGEDFVDSVIVYAFIAIMIYVLLVR